MRLRAPRHQQHTRDNGSGLAKGIIGLTNKGQARKPEDWGALRAWVWGVSRALDYLQTDKSVDAKRVGIEGVSRYGKAVVLVGSSGEGWYQTAPTQFRRSGGESHGFRRVSPDGINFLKYGTAQASFGSKNASNSPVDSNELIALCAPRLTFISYGVPEMGDSGCLHWTKRLFLERTEAPVPHLQVVKSGIDDGWRGALQNSHAIADRVGWPSDHPRAGL